MTVATWRHLDLTWDRATSILEFDFSFADLPEEAKIQEVRHVEAGRIRSSLVSPSMLKIETGRTSELGLDMHMSLQQSMAGFQIFLSRKINTYVLNYYVPSGLCVIVSWMSFFIPPDSVPARSLRTLFQTWTRSSCVNPSRITLIITTFLALVNIANSAFSNSPQADSINPIQVGSWLQSMSTRFNSHKSVFFISHKCTLCYFRPTTSNSRFSVCQHQIPRLCTIDAVL